MAKQKRMSENKNYIRKFRSMFHSPALKSIFQWARCVNGKMLAICVLTVISAVCSLSVTLATRSLIDGAVGSQTGLLVRSGIILAALIIGERVIAVSLSMLRVSASAGLQRHLQRTVGEALLTREYAGLKPYHSGELVNRYFSDIGVVKNGVVSILPSFVRIGVSFVGAAAILVSMDWRFVLLLIVGGLMGSSLVLLFREPMKRRHKRMQEAEGALHSSVQEALENIRLIKASVSERRVIRQIGGKQERLEQEQLRQGRFSTAMNNGIGFIYDLSWLFCMVWGCINIYHGRLTYGSLAAMIQLIGRIQAPIANAISLAGQAYGVISSAERLTELTGLPEEKEGTPVTSFDTIELRHVTFQYADGNEDVLRDLSCTVKRGDFMALTGISGGGKTSLFQLLLGIYKPSSGHVVFHTDGGDTEASRDTRKLFAYVPQGNMLFSGTLRDNLTMFTDQATEEEIEEAVRAACLEKIVAEIGLDAKLGERGVGLSEGQAQRVAVARALLSKAPVLLLDEATSALDEETEARLLQNISAMRSKTCIIVTHRRAALSICDYELNITDGRLIRSGVTDDMVYTE